MRDRGVCGAWALICTRKTLREARAEGRSKVYAAVAAIVDAGLDTEMEILEIVAFGIEVADADRTDQDAILDLPVPRLRGMRPPAVRSLPLNRETNPGVLSFGDAAAGATQAVPNLALAPVETLTSSPNVWNPSFLTWIRAARGTAPPTDHRRHAFDPHFPAIDEHLGLFRHFLQHNHPVTGLDLEDTGRPPDDQPQKQHDTGDQRATTPGGRRRTGSGRACRASDNCSGSWTAIRPSTSTRVIRRHRRTRRGDRSRARRRRPRAGKPLRPRPGWHPEVGTENALRPNSLTPRSRLEERLQRLRHFHRRLVPPSRSLAIIFATTAASSTGTSGRTRFSGFASIE